MTARDHDTWADSIGAYLLGALPEDERRGFEAHLQRCHVCREEADRLQVAADALPASPEQLSPPPELKDRIMAIVNSEAELLQAAGASADRPQPKPKPERKRRWSWSMRPGLALAGAAAALFIGVGVGTALRDGGEGSRVTTLEAKVDLPGPASARLEIDEEYHAKLVTSDIPSPEEGRVYQVWVVRDGEETPEATDALFTVNRDGSATVDVPVSVEDVDKVMVTSEPDGGSDAPTRQPFVVADLA